MWKGVVIRWRARVGVIRAEKPKNELRGLSFGQLNVVI